MTTRNKDIYRYPRAYGHPGTMEARRDQLPRRRTLLGRREPAAKQAPQQTRDRGLSGGGGGGGGGVRVRDEYRASSSSALLSGVLLAEYSRPCFLQSLPCGSRETRDARRTRERRSWFSLRGFPPKRRRSRRAIAIITREGPIIVDAREKSPRDASLANDRGTDFYGFAHRSRRSFASNGRLHASTEHGNARILLDR